MTALRGDAVVAASGSELRVGTATANERDLMDVATFSDGRVVVVWEGGGGTTSAIYAQVYAADGTADAQFIVDADPMNNHSELVVASLTGGGFVVARYGDDWADYNNDVIMAQLYDAGVAAVGGVITANTTASDHQRYPAVAASADGGFVLGWEGIDLDADLSDDILWRAFDSSGSPITSEAVVPVTTTSAQSEPAVGGLTGGESGVVWYSDHIGSKDNVALWGLCPALSRQRQCCWGGVSGQYRDRLGSG